MTPLFNMESSLLCSRRALKNLETSLDRHYRDTVKILQGGMRDPGQVEELHGVLQKFSVMGKWLGECRQQLNQETIPQVHEQLAKWNRDISQCLLAEPDSHMDARRLLIRALQSLTVAEGEFRRLSGADDQPVAAPPPRIVRVSTDLLYQCFLSLFPAERMLAIAGRTRGERVELGAVFDVTGVASAGHVRADPKKLGQALIAMTATDTHLAAWFHSHPGGGLMGTCPSGTDLRQHRDWLQDYSERLLSGIFVQDRYLRFWGSGLEQNQIRVELEGTGVEPVKGEQNVYQFIPG